MNHTTSVKLFTTWWAIQPHLTFSTTVEKWELMRWSCYEWKVFISPCTSCKVCRVSLASYTHEINRNYLVFSDQKSFIFYLTSLVWKFILDPFMFSVFFSSSDVATNETHSVSDKRYSATVATNTIKTCVQSSNESFTLYTGSLWLLIIISLTWFRLTRKNIVNIAL